MYFTIVQSQIIYMSKILQANDSLAIEFIYFQRSLGLLSAKVV